MKILCFIDSLGSGGAQRQIVALARGFKEKGHEVQFLTYHKINFFKPYLDEYEIPLQTIEESNYIKRIFKIRRAIRKEKPDAILSFLASANFMATLAGFPKKTWKLVVGERNAEPNITKSYKSLFFRSFHLFTNSIVANSYANLDLVKKANPFLKPSKMKVIYNIVNIPETKNKKYRNTSDNIHIVIAARYAPQKNIQGLIEAVNQLEDSYKKRLRIDWYGKIDTNNSYFKMALKKIDDYNLNKILSFYNDTNQIFEKFQCADYIGLFSHYEGFPNAICEAMALEKPIICSRVSDVPLIIKENKNGFLCDSNDLKSIQNALIKALNSTENERRKMGKNNKMVADEKFERNSIINQYLEILSS